MAAGGLLVLHNRGADGHASRWAFEQRDPGSRIEGTKLRATRGWRTLRAGSAYMAADPRSRKGGHFQEHRLNQSAPLVSDMADSVLVLSELVTALECQQLVAAADKWCRAHPAGSTDRKSVV